MAYVLAGLGGAQLQTPPAIAVVVGIGMGGIAAPGVELPLQVQRQGPALAQTQPKTQLRQQAARAKQQSGCGIDLGGEFQRLVKHLGHGEPGVALGALAVGVIQRVQQSRTKAPRHTATRQRPQAAPIVHAQPRQRWHMRSRCGQRVHRQGIDRQARQRWQLQTRQRHQGCAAVGQPWRGCDRGRRILVVQQSL